jgi:hypothetical protein
MTTLYSYNKQQFNADASFNSNTTFNNTSTQISSSGVVGISGGIVNISGDVINIGGGNVLFGTGNVGVGTTNPRANLHIDSASTLSRVRLSNTAQISNNFQGSSSEIAFDNPLSSLWHTSGYGNIPTTSARSAAYAAAMIKCLQTSGNNYEDSCLAFHTCLDPKSDGTGALGVLGEKMRISANGNVGIGTTEPGHKLDVVGTSKITNGNKAVHIMSNAASADYMLSLLDSGMNAGENRWFTFGKEGSLNNKAEIGFNYQGNQSNLNRMYLGLYGNQTIEILGNKSVFFSGDVNLSNGNMSLYNNKGYYLNNGAYSHSITMNFNTLSLNSKGDTTLGTIVFNCANGRENAAMWKDNIIDNAVGGLNSNFKLGQPQNIGYHTNTTTYGAARSSSSILFEGYRDALSSKISAKIVSSNLQTYSDPGLRHIIQSGNLQFYTVGPSSSGYDDTALRMIITDIGYVGIGTNNPEYPLEVSFSRYLTNFGGTGYVGGTTGLQSNGFNEYIGINVANSGSVRAAGFFSYSDKRIKNNIVDIDDNQALQQLRLIKPKTYDYVDKLQKGNANVIGFIAQEIKEIIPKAVTIVKDYVPTFYTNCQVAATDASNIVLVTSPIDLSWNALHDQSGNAFVDADGNACSDASGNKVFNVKLYDESNNEITCKTTSILDKRSFLMDVTGSKMVDASGNLQLESVGAYFLHGQEVDDFHNIDKSAIFTVVTAAVQDIDRIQQADSEKINVLEGQVTSLCPRVDSLTSEVASLTSEVASLTSEVASLTSEVASLTSQLSALQSQMAAVLSKLN